MNEISKIPIQDLLRILRCPKSHQALSFEDEKLFSCDGRTRFEFKFGVPDLRYAPPALKLSLPWVEPWEEIDNADLKFPEPLESADLPFHLDRYQASVTGEEGEGRWILEVGCGERHAEKYFLARNFNYVGTDYDYRGAGPDFLSDGHNLPLIDKSFDFVYSMSVYEHLMCPLLAATEAFRVLKPGGKFYGSAAFIYGYHDRASFNHMTHAGLIWMLRTAGFEDVKIWPGWEYSTSIPEWAFPGIFGAPWRVFNRLSLKFSDFSYTRAFNLARRITGRNSKDLLRRRSEIAGGLNFLASKPLGE